MERWGSIWVQGYWGKQTSLHVNFRAEALKIEGYFVVQLLYSCTRLLWEWAKERYAENIGNSIRCNNIVLGIGQCVTVSVLALKLHSRGH